MSAITFETAPTSWWQSRTTRRFLANRLATLGVVMIVLLTLACVLGPYLLPYDSLFIDFRARFAAPFTGMHFLGTDALGRDQAARLLEAGRISLAVGFGAMLLSTVIGVLIGVIAGYRGGWVGSVMMRLVDGFLAFPSIFLVLALSALLKPTPGMIAVIIAATSWMEVARIVEAEVRSLREREFIHASRMLGLSGFHIMFRDILPNAAGSIIVAGSLTIARAILTEAYVSFLGYGIQPPVTDTPIPPTPSAPLWHWNACVSTKTACCRTVSRRANGSWPVFNLLPTTHWSEMFAGVECWQPSNWWSTRTGRRLYLQPLTLPAAFSIAPGKTAWSSALLPMASWDMRRRSAAPTTKSMQSSSGHGSPSTRPLTTPRCGAP